MPIIVCENCKAQLTEYKRFCPECGARLPDPEPEKPAPVAPTVILPPAETPAGPAPIAPTMILPPVDQPAPARPDVTPTARLDDTTTPPSRADEPFAPTIIAPPTTPPATPPPPVGALPAAGPLGGLPPAEGLAGGLPPAGAAATPPASRRNLWLILGGVGCLSLILVGVCAVGLLTLLGSRASTVAGTAEPVAATAQGGGGIVPNDSPLAGGDVVFEDDFDSAFASGLGEDDDETARYAYEDGAYVVEVKKAETLVWARVDGSYDNARIEVDTEVPAGAEVSAAGLIFHYQDEDNFYLYSVSNDGYYRLELLEGNEWVVLIDWTQSDAVDAVNNRLQVLTEGDAITLLVNGEELEATSDGTFTSGEVGLAVSSLDEPSAEVRFDNMVIAQLE
jgi:hypothetical protein